MKMITEDPMQSNLNTIQKRFYISIWKYHIIYFLGIQVSLSHTLVRNEKVEYYIKINTHKPIILRFWVESSINSLCN